LKVKALALSLLIVLIALLEIPTAMASPDIYLKDSPASGVTVNPGKLMDFEAPTQADPAYLTTSNGIEYYWYSPPYVGTIPGPKGHAFHLYYTADAATSITVTVYIAVQPDGSGTAALISSKTYPLESASTVTHVVIPDVIVIPETKLNGERIKLSLSTEEPITVYYDSTATPSVLNFIPAPSPPPPAELLWMDPTATYDIALSKDGQYVAAVGPGPLSGELAFYDRSSADPKTPMWTWMYEGQGSLLSVAISYDGSCVAAGCADGYVFFWNDAKSRTPGDTDPTWTSDDLGGPIDRRCLDISNDGNYLVAGGTGDTIFYWKDAKAEGRDGKTTWTYGLSYYVDAVDLSSDGNYIAAGVEDNVAYWKDAKSLSGDGGVGHDPLANVPDWTSTWPSDIIRDIAISDDGNYVAAAGWFGVSPVYYWANAKILNGNPQTTWESAAGIPFSSIDMSSNGDKVIAGATGGPNPEDIGVYFWDGARTRSGTQGWSWHYTTASPVHDVAINAAGDYMAAANDVFEPRVYFFDSTGDRKWTYDLEEPVEPHDLSISSDGATLAIGTNGYDSRYLVSTGFRTPPARPVGGLLVPADKLALLSPWITLALAAVALTVFAAKRRRR